MEMLLFAGLGSLPMLLVGLLILCIVIAVAYWLITNLLPAPFQKWAIAVLVVVVAIVLIVYILIPLAGGGGGLGL